MRVPHLPAYLPQPDMTPMIDCVFLLMIFFMVSTDMGADRTAEVRLPEAESALEEDAAALEQTLILDVVQDAGSGGLPLLFEGRPVASLAELRRVLRQRSDPHRFPDRAAGMIPGTSAYPSARRLRIRCDREQLWTWVSAVMELCTLRRDRPLESELAESPLLRHIEVAVIQAPR